MDELSNRLAVYTILTRGKSTIASSKSSKKSTKKQKKTKDTVTEPDKIRELLKPIPSSANKYSNIASERFYITTAINYTNGLPHVGHAYEAITSDCLARYHRIFGRDTYFLTGTDEHGQKVEQSAAKQKKTPQQMADFYAGHFKKLDKDLEISYDKFIRTTDTYHKETCHKMWEKVFNCGDIYLKDYTGWYDVHSERYVTDHEAELSNYQDEFGRKYEKKSEESYFFKMSKYQEKLISHINSNKNFILPKVRENEILQFLKKPLHDLCITRTTCQWGIKIPFDQSYSGDKSHVMYVWFDALTNYLSGIKFFENEQNDEQNLKRFWPCDVHVIGKDISRFHCIIWPCMLMSAGIPLPKTVFGHGFVLDEEGKKMSKSLGNVIDPRDMISKYNVDCFRLYLIHETSYGSDLSFNTFSMISLSNSFLQGSFGNLLHRATSLNKAFSLNTGVSESKIPEELPNMKDLPFDLDELREEFEERMNKYELKEALDYLIIICNKTNKYVQDKEPWKLKELESKTAKLKKGEIIRTALESLFILAHFLEPFCPFKNNLIFNKLGVQKTLISKLNNNFINLPSDTHTFIGQPLYSPLSLSLSSKKNNDVKDVQKKEKKKSGKKNEGSVVEFDNEEEELFYKVEIRIGEIIKVWDHEETDNLFCEEIDIGEDKPRLIASGLRKYYNKEDILNKKILVICNLKPANLKGFKSYGMVLCASDKEKQNVQFCEPLDTVDGLGLEKLENGERVVLLNSKVNRKDIFDLTQTEIDEYLKPGTPNWISKKKIFPKVAQFLKTNSNCVACFKEKKLITLKSKIIIKSTSLADSQLS